MEYNFSNRMSALKPSAIREIFKVMGDPEIISFAAGNPAPETFPVEQMDQIAQDIFSSYPSAGLQYGVTEGYLPLIKATRDRISTKYNLGRDSDDLIITSGGQQAIELFTKVMVNEGDAVICEEPSFIGALNAFRSYNARLIGVGVEQDGMDLNALENALQNNNKIKFIYTIPTFQNPSGYTMSLKKRHEILKIAEKYGVMILEDNPYFELRYSGEYVQPIKSLDEDGRVLYAGSYSKVISPGMRVGFALGPKNVIEKMVVAKQVSDVHTNLFFSILVAEFLRRYDLDAHIEKSRAIYRVKRDLMVSTLRDTLPEEIEFSVPDGGLFLWCSLPSGSDGNEFAKMLIKQKVAVVPGSSFMTDENAKCPGIRLNFSLPSSNDIVKGTQVLSRVAGEFIK